MKEDVFWKRLKRVSNGCRIWNGATGADGYGNVRFRGRTFRVHRLAFELANGRAPNGLVLHRCDRPLCGEPTHLFEGTQLDNVRDMDAKGRRVVNAALPSTRGANHWTRRKTHPYRGERHHSSRLKNERLASLA